MPVRAPRLMPTDQAALKNRPKHCLKTAAILCGIGGLLLTAREASATVPQLQPASRKPDH